MGLVCKHEDIFVHLKNQFHKSIYTTTWMSLRSPVLSERSQTQGLYTLRFHLYEILEKAKSIVAESRRLWPRMGEGALAAGGQEGAFLGM